MPQIHPLNIKIKYWGREAKGCEQKGGKKPAEVALRKRKISFWVFKRRWVARFQPIKKKRGGGGKEDLSQGKGAGAPEPNFDLPPEEKTQFGLIGLARHGNGGLGQ